MTSEGQHDFAARLKEAFLSEAKEQVKALLACLIKIEGSSDARDRQKLINAAFREMHNLKGSARAVEFHTISQLCHPLEDLLALARSGEQELTASHLDLLFTGTGVLEKLLNDEELSADEKTLRDQLLNQSVSPSEPDSNQGDTSADAGTASETIVSVSILPAQIAEQAPLRSSGDGAAASATMRINATKLDAMMNRAEEMLSIKSVARESAYRAGALMSFSEEWSRKWRTVSADLRNGKAILERVSKSGELSPHEEAVIVKIQEAIDQSGVRIGELTALSQALRKATSENFHTTSNAVDFLLDEAKQLLMMPCSTILEGLPVVVRQLSKDMGKLVELVIEGSEVEIDKRVLEAVKDPLLHIVRNSLDHGIESPADRTAAGKSPQSKLSISVYHYGGSSIEIRIKDDGRGIDPAKVKLAAVKAGIISAEESTQISDLEAMNLIFRPAISTSSQITEISGRGVGLSVVDENTRKLGGSARVNSKLGAGTTFYLRLPTTLASFRGVVITANRQKYVLPTRSVERVLRIRKDLIKQVDGQDSYLINGLWLSVYRLADIMGLPPLGSSSQLSYNVGAVVGEDESRAIVLFDDILEEQEVLVKGLSAMFASVRMVVGVTVLGDGQVVPILDCDELGRNGGSGKVIASRVADGEGIGAAEKRVLVVDDTLTARMLLKNAFESAGYVVTTASDGAEALKSLANEMVDLVVTDLEMPNMDGFELTRSIRANPELKRVPVVIVTSKSSKEDRERGLHAGASAFFVKSSFDQQNLLEVSSSLIGNF